MVKKKGKGRKKGGKGKKGKKQEPKANRESDAERARVNATLWESRLDVTEKSRMEYRETARMLARANESLINQRVQIERDTVEVISYLKKQDMQKNDQISKLQLQLSDQKKEAHEQHQNIIENYTGQINELEEKVSKKANEIQLIQGELNRVKEFRRKQIYMKKELDAIKDTMSTTIKEHTDTLRLMEGRFFEEKVRLEKEAEQKLVQLTEQAHTEAIVNLENKTRCVFKENVRLTGTVKVYIKEAEYLKKINQHLKDQNMQLFSQKETSEVLVKEKLLEVKQLKDQIQQLQKNMQNLEKALGHMAREFETAKWNVQHQSQIKTQTNQVEITRLETVIKMKDKEMNRVKTLARSILDQRTDVEIFFLESLEEVKKKIICSRLHYKKAAEIAFNKKMKKAYEGKEEYPKIRTFSKDHHSTNNVYQDMEEAEKWINIKGNKIDIGDLTWEQKEKVLRLLFARMNRLAGNINENASFQKVFITEAPDTEVPTDGCMFPSIPSAKQMTDETAAS
ncbi:basal body-orientation factor 1 [Callorhinchus milii]|uniref:Basal body-orientation factor 1 n=1 Tax=Callorhinchus milii TaxID=7868 RepID=V9KQ10_CALMI|nr:basal body-orientation factor 1 [Callorhinchus milii]|eukprot:gi/632975416/ref/XP_007904217.1/ PREDICTED: basal body-orientation factor 1 [Callorhinchus milii]